MKENTVIRRERPEDFREVENMVREAFWNVYQPGCMEHYLLHCLRNDPAALKELDLVMEKEGRIIGQIFYMRSEIVRDDGTRLPVLTFGPMSIHPDYARQGYGLQLLNASLKQAEKLGAGAVCITGNIEFYGKAGFTLGTEWGVYHKEEAVRPYFLVKELKKGYLENVKGTYSDPEGYMAAASHPEELEAFDAQFPPKEKKKLPGQLF
jgi:putative acetyltransferase